MFGGGFDHSPNHPTAVTARKVKSEQVLTAFRT